MSRSTSQSSFQRNPRSGDPSPTGTPRAGRSAGKSGKKATYFGYESKYPHPADEARVQRRQDSAPARFEEKSLGPQYSNFRGHTKCRFCSKFVIDGMMEEHYEECPLVNMRCELRDTETDEPCFHETRGRRLMEQHQLICPFRTELCENRGCGQAVSVRSKKFHLSRCNYQRIACPTCGQEFQRNELSAHEGCCPEAIVECPLGCGETMRLGDLDFHIRNNAATHADCVQRATKSGVVSLTDPRSVYAILVGKIAELEQRLEYFSGSPNAKRSPSRQTSTSEVPETPNHPPPKESQKETQPKQSTPRPGKQIDTKNQENVGELFPRGESQARGAPKVLETTSKPNLTLGAQESDSSQLSSSEQLEQLQFDLNDYQRQLEDLADGMRRQTVTKISGSVARENLTETSSQLKLKVVRFLKLHPESGKEGNRVSRHLSRLDRTWCTLQVDLYQYTFHS